MRYELDICLRRRTVPFISNFVGLLPAPLLQEYLFCSMSFCS